jgi:DNA repair protein RecN (Recombination protein N)
MLVGLNFKNFTVIDELAVSFGPGLNIITGETGAGKSVIVDAVNLILGDRVSPEYIKTGGEEAHLEALFDISGQGELMERLRSLGLEMSDGELLVKRIIYRRGRSRTFINGSIATLQILEQASEGIIDIFSQHEHQSLLREENHLKILDEYGGLGGLVTELGSVYSIWREVMRERGRLTERQSTLLEREDFLKFQCSEIDDALLREGEDKDLEDEKRRLLNSERLLSAAQGSYDALYESEPSLLGSLKRLSSDVREASGIDPSLEQTAEALDNAAMQLKDAAFTLRDYASALSFENGRLEVIENRLQVIKDLKRKFGETIEEILKKREELGRELHDIAGYEDELTRLEGESGRLKSELDSKAEKITQMRREKAIKLSRSIERELKEVGIKGARFSADIEEKDISADGKDGVSFLFSANPDEEPKPLARVASGGELSRIMLVLKELIVKTDGGSVIIFDEADSGIGGAVAETVGKKISKLSEHCQVICITHLPQVAKFADTHLLVKKTFEDGKTRVEIKALGPEERVSELARMIGGINVTEKTIETAKEMLGN